MGASVPPPTRVSAASATRRSVGPRPSVMAWVDAGIVASTSMSLVTAVALAPMLGSARRGAPLSIAPGLAYAVAALALLALLARALIVLRGGSGRPRPRSLTLRLEGRWLLAVPGLCGLVALGVLLFGGIAHVGAAPLALAALGLLLVIVRTGIALRENISLLEQSRRDAITDSLTGLGNRRHLNEELRAVLPEGHGSAPAPALLAIFDLDGFKRYNDRFGHLAGDALLTHLAGQLQSAVAGYGSAFRLGGDEFCILVRGGGDAAERTLRAAVRALSARGDGFSVRSSYGRVEIPREAATAADALSLADARMYALKDARHGRAPVAAHDILAGLVRGSGAATPRTRGQREREGGDQADAPLEPELAGVG